MQWCRKKLYSKNLNIFPEIVYVAHIYTIIGTQKLYQIGHLLRKKLYNPKSIGVKYSLIVLGEGGGGGDFLTMSLF